MASEKYVVLEGGVGPYPPGTVLTEDDLAAYGVERLIDLGALAPAGSAEAKAATEAANAPVPVEPPPPAAPKKATTVTTIPKA